MRKIMLMFPRRVRVLRTLHTVPTGCKLVFYPEGAFPPFTIENMTNYFIKRKSGDNEGNKDYKNLNSKAFGLFKHGHVQMIEVARGLLLPLTHP